VSLFAVVEDNFCLILACRRPYDFFDRPWCRLEGFALLFRRLAAVVGEEMSCASRRQASARHD
jgi:hypothetical protein